ncbi:hypothetical protein [Saccharomonospora sp. NB11]|jgi:hypothetical protein|uniref:hypothetical protein n=1 Tax=Saccharomonospora sp. NB11 TaxID=1642298 RepID=UPI0018D17586|nr:hypothetical protein [Saccharomonospora sp. NB11]
MDEFESADAEGDRAPGEGDRNTGDVTVDCHSCVLRDRACGNCVVTAMVDRVGPPRWGPEELRALALLADVGLLPPLRYEAA